MKKIFKNRLFLGIFCFTLATFLAFFVAPHLNELSQNEVPVCISKTEITKGTLIEEKHLKMIEIPQKYLPQGSLTDESNIVGKYATIDILENDFIYKEKISTSPTVQNNDFKNLDENNVAISVTIKTFAAGLSAKLQPDDIISFISANGIQNTNIPPELKYMRVLSVTTDLATDYNAQASENTTMPVSVTVSATPEQAVLLSDLELNSNLHIVLVNRGDKEKATQLLAEQQTLLENIETPVEPTEPEKEVS